MILAKRLKALEQAAKDQLYSEPFILELDESKLDCLIGFEGLDSTGIVRLPDESVHDAGQRWMKEYYTKEFRRKCVLPLLWCVYDNERLFVKQGKQA